MKDFKRNLKDNAIYIALFLGISWLPASVISTILMGFGIPFMCPAFIMLYICVPFVVVLSLASEVASNKSFLIYDIVMIFMHIINIVLSIVFFNP